MKQFVVAILAAGAMSAAQSTSVLPRKEAEALAAHARTSSDHLRLAAHYRQLAMQFAGQSKEHARMADGYRRIPIYTSSKFKSSTIGHCDYFAASFKEKAMKMSVLADGHEKAARRSGQ